MKLYRANMYSAEEGTLVSWHTSKREAEAAVREFERSRGENAWQPGDVEQVDVPTHRAGLIVWLNSNFKTDNG